MRGTNVSCLIRNYQYLPMVSLNIPSAKLMSDLSRLLMLIKNVFAWFCRWHANLLYCSYNSLWLTWWLFWVVNIPSLSVFRLQNPWIKQHNSILVPDVVSMSGSSGKPSIYEMAMFVCFPVKSTNVSALLWSWVQRCKSTFDLQSKSGNNMKQQ